MYANKSEGYVERAEITQNYSWVDKYKVYITMAYGAGEDFLINNKQALLGKPNTCCTETYVVIGPYANKELAENVISYIKTRFSVFSIVEENTQHASSMVYSFVPLQDFSKPWTDEELYVKYGLADDETAFIESMIRPME